MVKVFSVNYQSLLKCTNCFPSSVILSHQCQKMSKEVWQVCGCLQGVLKGAGVQCKQKETPNRSMDGQNRRTLRGLHQVYLKTMAHTFLSQFVGVVVTSLWSHLCLLWWSWFISARCFFQLKNTQKSLKSSWPGRFNHWRTNTNMQTLHTVLQISYGTTLDNLFKHEDIYSTFHLW